MIRFLKQKDKQRHLIVGAIITILFLNIGFYFSDITAFNIHVITAILVFIIGYAFELFSKFTGYGHYDFLDAIATVYGYPVGAFFYYIPQIFDYVTA